MSSVLVMGGTGFIGTEVVRALKERGDVVYALARSQVAAKKLTELGCEPILGDVYQPDEWISKIPDIDYVINVLGFFTDGPPHRLSVGFAQNANAKYTIWADVLVRIAKEKKVKAAVHVTGATIYEPHPTRWINENTPLRFAKDGFNRIAYSATKIMIDAINEGLPIIVAVAPNIVYGPVPKSSFEMVFVEPLRKNQMGIVGHGRNYIPTGHVHDVGRAIAFVTDQRYAGEFFLIAGDDAVTQREFMRAIADGIGKKSVLTLPKPVVAVMGGRAGAEFMSLSQRIDNSKLRKLGFEFRYPNFMNAIGGVMKDLELERKKGASAQQH